jgi:aspartyl-tRNA(Asn)/glutamyl-tRNA(Gln) amidotransferase subunit A
MASPIHDLTIKSFGEGLREKKFSAFEITKAFLARIETHDKEIGAYLSLNKDGALEAAKKIDVAVVEGKELSPLAGVPMALKDNMLVEGLPATAGSKILKDYRAAYDATVVAKLRSAGAVILGKTNLDEFAMGSSTENSAFQITKNPHDLTRVPGGSSGGSAAAVAGDMALGALGSDTGGSIREPASFCGVVGMKPTYGAVSRYGLIAMASSLDQIGPFAKTVEDAALIFRAIAGADPFDATSAAAAYDDELTHPDFENVKKLTIGLPKEYFGDGIDTEVQDAVASAIETIMSLGIAVKEVSLPHTKYALSTYYITMPAEVSSNLARFDGMRYGRSDKRQATSDKLMEVYKKTRREGFGPEARRRIILGTFVLSSGYYDAYYAKAQKVRRLIKEDFDNAFKEVDIILGPVAPTPAFKLGEKTADPLQMYLSDIFTIPVNLAGLPAISIPVRGQEGLPIGFQLIGRHFREADIFGLGYYYEKA